VTHGCARRRDRFTTTSKGPAVRTDEELMQAYQVHADKRAFAALYQSQAPTLRRFVQKRLYRADEVEDIVQQTFMRLHTVKDSYRAGEPVRPWLCTIAGNLVRDQLRKQQRRPEVIFDLARHASFEPRTEQAEMVEPNRALEAALAHLSEVTQRIMEEHFAQERPLIEIAQELGENPSTVRVKLHRGCRRLREQLAI
jgi:RNA polymerase sigma-70 factor (ECF subfamily)